MGDEDVPGHLVALDPPVGRLVPLQRVRVEQAEEALPRGVGELARKEHGRDGEDREEGEPALSRRERRMNDVTIALSEAEDAIAAVMQGAPATALRPQSPPIRRMQHEMAERYNLASRSRGRDPFRHVEIFRQGMQ